MSGGQSAVGSSRSLTAHCLLPTADRNKRGRIEYRCVVRTDTGLPPMPTFQFEAMDATGAEIKDVIEAATEEEAQATIRQMGYFVTKISVKKARKKAEGRRRQEAPPLRHRRRQEQAAHHLHPPALDSARRRPADPAYPAHPRRAVQARPAQELADRHLRRHRSRRHALRGHGQEPQGLRPPVRQHDQGRRSGRRPGSHSPAPGRVQGTRRSRSSEKSKAR